MKEARIQVKLPLNAPTVGEAVENEAEAEAALQPVEKKTSHFQQGCARSRLMRLL